MLNANLEFTVSKKVFAYEVEAGDRLTIHSINRSWVFGHINGRKVTFSIYDFNWLIQQGIIKIENVEIPAPKEKPLPLLAAVL